MSCIYYIWKHHEAYVGLDSGSGYDRIQEHIKSVLTKTTDSTRDMIKKYGITGVSYGIFLDNGGDTRWGLPKKVLDEFKKIWMPSDDLQLAEILHIIWAKIWGVKLHNITVGGQLTGCTVKYAQDPSLTIHLGDKLDNWNRVRKKILYPEIYGLLKKICNEVLIKEYRKPSFWESTLIYILKNPNESYARICSNLEKITTKSLLREVGNILGPDIQQQYKDQIKKGVYLPLNSLVKEYYFWVKQHINPNIHKNIEDIVNEIYTGWQGKRKKGNSDSRVKRMVFTFNPSELYADFKEPKKYPTWYQSLVDTPHTIKPEIWSGNDPALQLAIKEASYSVFSRMVTDAKKKWAQYTNFILKPQEPEYLKTRVALEYKQYGIDVYKFFHNWHWSYRQLISLWMYKNNYRLIQTLISNNKYIWAYSSVIKPDMGTPLWFYTFRPETWSIIQTIKSLDNIHYNLF